MVFEWHENGGKSIDPFSRPCPKNQTFSPMNFSCVYSRDHKEMMRRICNETKDHAYCKSQNITKKWHRNESLLNMDRYYGK